MMICMFVLFVRRNKIKESVCMNATRIGELAQMCFSRSAFVYKINISLLPRAYCFDCEYCTVNKKNKIRVTQ